MGQWVGVMGKGEAGLDVAEEGNCLSMLDYPCLAPHARLTED